LDLNLFLVVRRIGHGRPCAPRQEWVWGCQHRNKLGLKTERSLVRQRSKGGWSDLSKTSS
jgi:hypothetical protein